MTDYAGMIGDMWFSVFGNTLLGCIAILIALFFMCDVRRFDLERSTIVILPTVFGITTAEYLPLYVKALFIMPIVFLWIRALIRLVGLG